MRSHVMNKFPILEENASEKRPSTTCLSPLRKDHLVPIATRALYMYRCLKRVVQSNKSVKMAMLYSVESKYIVN